MATIVHMKSSLQKSIVTLVAVGVVALAIVIVGPVLYRIFTDEGVRTGGLDTANVEPASTDRNGHWKIVGGDNANNTSVGFTFNELLPGSQRTTSASTHNVTGEFNIKEDKLTDGNIVVDMATLNSDIERRDINARQTIFLTDTYPESKFEVSKPVDISQIPDSGAKAPVEIEGRLTIMGITKDVTVPMQALRTGNLVMLEGTLKINRLDFNVRTPQFVAAKIAEEGELNLRIVAEKA